ncbi:unnamed protein product [Moneuplotes crassus]|uniref:Uncharacterized protein n=1 Tax=Euplotes crassus TaxID=5936 RepID=A0AAD1Y1M7_EUPCR|nr:unnamed protein product [Moneuplotes crassus]
MFTGLSTEDRSIVCRFFATYPFLVREKATSVIRKIVKVLYFIKIIGYFWFQG